MKSSAVWLTLVFRQRFGEVPSSFYFLNEIELKYSKKMLIHRIYFFSFNACGDLSVTNYLYSVLKPLHNIFFSS